MAASNETAGGTGVGELDSLSDAQAVELSRRGDERAFEVLYRRYKTRVYAVAFGFTRNRDEALDVAQEAFTKVFRHLGSFKGDSSFYTWLYRITVNICIDHARRARRSRSLEVEFVDDRKLASRDARRSDNPGDNASRRELIEQLSKAIDQLPPYHREVIVMREVGGLSYEEIARATRVSKGTVMSRLFHARRKVREKMQRLLGRDHEGQ